MRKKGIIPTITIITGMVIYGLFAIYVFDWTGIYRTILAAIIGGLLFSLGKRIEKIIFKYGNQKTEVEHNTHWLNIFSFIIIIGIVLGINIYTHYKASNWKTYKDEVGNFSIEFPENPNLESREQSWKYGYLTWKIIKVNSDEKDLNIHYLVRYCDLPKWFFSSDSLQYIQDLANLTQVEISNKVGASGLNNLSIKQINKYPGREYRWKDLTDKVGYTTRFFFVKRRFYVLEVKYILENDFNNDIEGFLDKFKLLKITENNNPEILPERPIRNFVIEFPMTPKIRENPVYHELTGNVYGINETYEVPGDQKNDPNIENLAYGINYAKLPQNTITSDSLVLIRKFISSAIETMGKVMDQKEIEINAGWGVEAKVEAPNFPAIYHVKMFIINDMLYQILVVSKKGKENNKAERDFINSFKLR
ncbi:MAG: hypothetical protein U0W24_00010 [Bacteroidales bacterium]